MILWIYASDHPQERNMWIAWDADGIGTKAAALFRLGYRSVTITTDGPAVEVWL